MSNQTSNIVELPNVDFGNGKYSNVMRELYKDSARLLGITPKQAEHVARAFGADLGRNKTIVESIRLSTVNKNQQMTLRESTTIKGMVMTNSLRIAKLCVLFDECRKYGVLTVKPAFNPELTEWIDGKSVAVAAAS